MACIAGEENADTLHIIKGVSDQAVLEATKFQIELEFEASQWPLQQLEIKLTVGVLDMGW